MTEESAPTDKPQPPVVVRSKLHTWMLVAVFAVMIGGWVDLNIKNANLRNAIEQQGALLSRVVGTVVPVKLPDNAMQELDRIEKALESFEKNGVVPPQQGEAQSLAEALSGLVGDMPTWVQSEFFPRILPARWRVDTYLLAERPLPDDANGLQDLADALTAHAFNRPQTVPEKLEIWLLKHAEQVQKKLDQREQVESKERERQAFEFSVKGRIEALENDMANFEKLGKPSLQARMVADAQVALQGIQVLAITGELQNDEFKQRVDVLAESVAEARKAVQSAQDSVARQYQIWALDQMRSVPELKKLKDEKVAAIKSSVDRLNPLSKASEAAAKAAQDELAHILIDKLSIIDTRWLDTAVGEWYGKVFNSRFGTLDEAHQLEVVEGFAESTKRLPEPLP